MIRKLYGLGDYNFTQIRDLAKDVEETGLDPATIFYRRPDAADSLEFITKIPPEEAAYFVPDAFAEPKGAALAKQLSIEQLTAIGSEGDEFLRAAIKINLEKAFKGAPNDIHLRELVEYVNSSPAWQ